MTEPIFLTNGKIYPLNGLVPRVEALSITGGKIRRLGTHESVAASLPDSYTTIDLEGRTAVPAFSDNYARIGREAFVRIHLDLSPHRTIPEIFAEVEQAIKKTPSESWIVGFGWNKSQWGWKRFPHRADLDLVAPHHPVALFSSDHRVAWLNSAAVSAIDLRHDTPDPPGGEIERDPVTVSATGILKEKALDLVSKHLPKHDGEESESALLQIVQDYLAMGVTSIESFDSIEDIRLLVGLDEKGELPIQVTTHPRFAEREEVEGNGWKIGSKFNRLTIGGPWVAVDGTLSSQTAFLLEPYADDWNEFGIEITPTSELEQVVDYCLKNNCVPILVSSGDRATRNVLKVLSERSKGSDVRPVLVGGDLIHPDDLGLVSGLNLSLITNPRRIQSDREAGKIFWGPRWNDAINLAAWKNRGTQLLFGSGEPLLRWTPMRALEAAVTTPHERDSSCAISVEVGLLALAGNLSSHAGPDSSSGLISPGQTANIAVLTEDPFLVDPSEIGRIQVDMTLSADGILYDRQASSSSLSEVT